METALGVLVVAMMVGIAGLAVLGMWKARMSGAALGSVLVLGAVVVALVLSALGVFVARAGTWFPPITLGIALPLLAGLWFLRRSQFLEGVSDASLIRFHGFRIGGAVFLAYLALGGLPREFALPAGLGDVLVGVTALLVAHRVKTVPARSRRLAGAWNVLGLIDFALAVGTGFLTAPSPFQLLALDNPNTLITAFPLVLIPTFGVPLFALLHIASLRRLLVKRGSAEPRLRVEAGATDRGSGATRRARPRSAAG
jgi:hypothetical protein